MASSANLEKIKKKLWIEKHVNQCYNAYEDKDMHHCCDLDINTDIEFQTSSESPSFIYIGKRFTGCVELIDWNKPVPDRTADEIGWWMINNEIEYKIRYCPYCGLDLYSIKSPRD